MAEMQKEENARREKVRKRIHRRAPKDYYYGIWCGRRIHFNRYLYGIYRMTDEECAALCRGEALYCDVPRSDGDGTIPVVCGLTDRYYEDIPYVGATCHILDNIPNAWCLHRFTAGEKLKLTEGEPVELHDCVSDTGVPFSCTLTYRMNSEGDKRLVPEFA